MPVEAEWKPPATIPAEWVTEGREFLDDLMRKDVPCRDIPGGLMFVRKWISDLIDGYAHGLDGPTFRSRGSALADAVEKFPPWCFTRETRIEAATEVFAYVPTTKELFDFIKRIDNEYRRKASRVMKIVQAGSAPPKPRPDDDRPEIPWSYERGELRKQEIAEETNRRREADFALHAAGGEPFPIQGAGESDDLFHIRRMQYIRKNLDDATKHMNQFKPRAGKQHVYSHRPATGAIAVKRREMEERAIREAAAVDETLAGKEKGIGDEKSDAA